MPGLSQAALDLGVWVGVTVTLLEGSRHHGCTRPSLDTLHELPQSIPVGDRARMMNQACGVGVVTV